MVIDAILHTILSVVTSIMSVFPTLPAMDSSIVAAGAWVTSMLGQGSAFAEFLYGTTLLTALVTIFIAVWAFEPVYHAVMWVIRKIPFLNVH